jgi:hypothetical protein
MRSVECAKQVQKDNDEDWHAGHPQDDVSKHRGFLLAGWGDAMALIGEW